MSNLEYNNHNFEIDKIVEHLESITDKNEKIKYINRLTKEFEQFMNSAIPIQEPRQNYLQNIRDEEIPFLCEDLNRLSFLLEAGVNQLKVKDRIKENHSEDYDIKRIYVKSSITDIVRIFEAMKKAGIISIRNNEVSKIAGLFFSDSEHVNKFTAQYNARKKETYDNQRSSNSEELAQFIKIIIGSSFAKKYSILEGFIKHIEDIQKNII